MKNSTTISGLILTIVMVLGLTGFIDLQAIFSGTKGEFGRTSQIAVFVVGLSLIAVGLLHPGAKK